jgi:hypothetical protein
MAAFVGRCSKRVETGLPELQTPPIFEVVAPPSVPMYTCWAVLIGGESYYRSTSAAELHRERRRYIVEAPLQK